MTLTSLHRTCTTLALSLLLASPAPAEPLPSRLQGTWHITRVLPTSNTGCWGTEQAEPMVGSSLTYSDSSLRWRDGSIPLSGITTRTVTSAQFSKENGGAEGSASFSQLGIHANSVTEVDLQHEDMDITGATTEVPGDSVLLAGPNRIVIQACGVFFEATRASSVNRATLTR